MSLNEYFYNMIPSKRQFKIKRPREKIQILDEYILSHDLITKEYMLSIGISKFESSLRYAEKRTKSEILQINHDTWMITK
jgi:hypothetical protein